MIKTSSKRLLALLLAAIMVIGIVPVTAFAVNGSVTDYSEFMSDLKQLEVYAAEYAPQVGRDAGELVLNYIRTGVERYMDGNWTTLAGQEIVGFTNYVKQQDADRGTSVEDLRDIVTDNFYLPNGNQVDFGHMFGCMNISYVSIGSADLSGWAGDICDLLQYSVKSTTVPSGTIDSMAAYIKAKCFGVDASGAFGWDDFWGDMDAYYIINEYSKAKGSKNFSEIMEAYFTATLNDTDRTVYFMNNRFGVENSQEAVRKAIYEAYSADVGIDVLEASRGLSSYRTLRQACCYAVADYIWEKAQGKLVEKENSGESADNEYYSVFSDEKTVLAPGITQNIKYAQTADGKQIVYYVATVNVNDPSVHIMANYADNQPVPGKWKLQTVMDQANAMVANKDKYKDPNGNSYEYFTPVVATNGDGYNIYNGTPGGLLIMNGTEYYPVDGDGFFAILDDGSAVIGTKADYETYKGRIKEAIGGFGAVLIKDGKINVTKNPNYTSQRASRTAVGITATGEVVMMVMDGRQQPFSAGGSMEEIAQVMLDAGCVHAINLDGGGSTTYLSKPAGSDTLQLTNRPSDGYQRTVAVSLVAVSTAKPSNEFDEAIISSDYEYITAGTSMQFNVTGVSNTGNAAIIPEGAYWRVSDENLATIDETGLFTAAWSEEAPITGKVTVEFVVGDEVKGSKDIEIVIPDDIKFVEDRIVAIYGVPKEIGITLWYQGKQVAFTPFVDAAVLLYSFDEEGNMIPAIESNAGVIEGLTFIGDDSYGVRIANIVAALAGDDAVARFSTINLYYADEATFDFDNATAGNRALAYIREIENARSTDNKTYRVIDETMPIKVDYTFALDMTAIEMPAQLEPLKSMLPGGTNPDSIAWDFLLSLAERVCVQTNVKIRVELSPELDVDISGLKVVTEYFNLTSAHLDENNVLTIVCNWKDQTQAINPATANSLCILNGISATVKDSASFFESQATIVNNGTVSYDIYLATSALHSFASNPSNQAQYGLYPYEHSDYDYPNGCRIGDHDSGGHFAGQYLDFQDMYTVVLEGTEGWIEENGDFYFYKNNLPVSGIQLVPDREDSSKLRFYEFDANGKLMSNSAITGLQKVGDDLYYAVLGVAETGWREVDGKFYYFHPDTGKAVDGKFTIRESKNSWQTGDFEYTFKDHVLVLGVWEYDTYQGQSGWRYRWAGDWKKACWFEVEGETYHVTKNYPYYVTTGYASYIKNYPSEKQEDLVTCLFDEYGRLMKDYTGPANAGGTMKFFKNGILYSKAMYPRFNGSTWTKGIVQGSDGYYYFVNDDAAYWQDKSAYITVEDWTGGYITAGKQYTFDALGRMTTPLIKTDDIKLPANDSIEASQTKVEGKVVTVTVKNENAPTFKVGYKDAEGNYVSVEVNKNSETTFSFAAGKDADELVIVVTGDTSGDGVADESDAQALKNEILNKQNDSSTPEVADTGKLAGDIDGDGEITALDIALMFAAASGAIKLGW